MNAHVEVWRERVRRFGRRAAINLSISESEIGEETRRVESILFPLVLQELAGQPTRILDYGCGWGRFTADLARAVKAVQTVGYDPCPELIQLAGPVEDVDVTFVTGSVEQFFTNLSAPFELIWVQAVLGGIADTELAELAGMFTSALSPNGLLFFVEDTSPIDPTNSFWHVRLEQHYVDIFGAQGFDVRVAGTFPTRFGGTKSVFSSRMIA